MALPQQKLGKQTEGDNVTTHIDLLIYGRSGAGKTRFASTAPKPYMVSPDPTGHKSVPYEIDGVVPKKVSEIYEVKEEFYKGGHGYKTLIIDGLSWIYDMYVAEVGQYFHEKMGAKDPDLMPIQGRTKINNRFSGLVKDLVNLTQVENPEDRVHVIFTTLDTFIGEDETTPHNVIPLIGSEKINTKVTAFFAVVGYIWPRGQKKENNEFDRARMILFGEANGVQARDRLDMFPPHGEAPSLSDYLS